MHTSLQTEAVETVARIDRIRRSLPGQIWRERLDEARLRYGVLYTLEQVRDRVARTLPRRFGRIRTATFQPIENYRSPIPGDVLLKYGDAKSTELFERFLVATPCYSEQAQIDPWILAQVAGTEWFAIIGQWDAV